MASPFLWGVASNTIFPILLSNGVTRLGEGKADTRREDESHYPTVL